MAELKTKVNRGSVAAFIVTVPDLQKRRDCRELVTVMQRITRAKPEMWGTSIIGFGRYQYRYPGGRIAEWCLTGFSPRKQSLTLYLMGGLERHAAELRKLGTHKTGRTCLYIKSLDDVDRGVLAGMIRTSVREMRKLSKENQKAKPAKSAAR